MEDGLAAILAALAMLAIAMCELAFYAAVAIGELAVYLIVWLVQLLWPGRSATKPEWNGFKWRKRDRDTVEMKLLKGVAFLGMVLAGLVLAAVVHGGATLIDRAFYRQVQLVDDRGKPIPFTWLEIGEEGKKAEREIVWGGKLRIPRYSKAIAEVTDQRYVSKKVMLRDISETLVLERTSAIRQLDALSPTGTMGFGEALEMMKRLKDDKEAENEGTTLPLPK